MTLYRLRTWSHGQWHYCCSADPPRFAPRRRVAKLFTEEQVDGLRKRFRKGSTRMTLRLEEVVEAEARKPSEPLSDRAKRFSSTEQQVYVLHRQVWLTLGA